MSTLENAPDITPALIRASSALRRTTAVQSSRSEQNRTGPLGFLALVFCGIVLSFVAHTIQSLLSSEQSVVHGSSDASVMLSNDELRSSYFKLLGQRQEQISATQIRALQSFVLKHSRGASQREALRLAQIIYDESERANVNPWFVAAVIKSESNFRIGAVSPVNARGLMQILPSTGKYIAEKKGIRWQGVDALFDAQYNVRLGIAYLQYLGRYFGNNYNHLLVAYNWGPANTKRAIAQRTSFPNVSKRYASTILKDFETWSPGLHFNS